MPLYVLGFWGATRRMQHIPDPTWAPWLNVALVGAIVIGLGIVLTVVQLLYSIKTRDQRRDITGDPWDGRTLEWLTLSPRRITISQCFRTFTARRPIGRASRQRSSRTR
jgi:cytochrome o ubiquinol oxidase subunit 1